MIKECSDIIMQNYETPLEAFKAFAGSSENISFKQFTS